jgi:ferric-dicitrate binding protein FerR (iron transport regulator)
MEANRYSARDIIVHLIFGPLPEDEQQVLDKWVTNLDNKRFLEEITNRDNLLQDLKLFEEAKKEAMLIREKVLQAYYQETGIAIGQRKWINYATVAATLLLVLSAGFFFLVNHRKSPEPPVTNNKSSTQPGVIDIPPGKHKATLVLADGTKITLDSVSRGQLPQQGNTNINNIDGRVEYHTGLPAMEGTLLLYNTLKTEIGQTYQVVLPDGSKAWLNAASSIRYPAAFSGKEREVTITGEAYFEIKSLVRDHGEKVPFIVTVEDTAGNTNEEVEVLGTQFNINAYKEEKNITTTLLDGKVRIKKEKNVILSEPNQQGVLSKATGDIDIVRNVNVEKIVSWKNNYFYFDRDSLATVIKQVARWYDVYFVIDKRLSNKTFSGRIPRNMPLSKILEKVEKTSGVKFDIHEGKRSFTISPKPKP